MWHGKDAQEIRSSEKDMRHMRPTICLAQEMGKGLGRGPLLLGPVQGWAA